MRYLKLSLVGCLIAAIVSCASLAHSVASDLYTQGKILVEDVIGYYESDDSLDADQKARRIRFARQYLETLRVTKEETE